MSIIADAWSYTDAGSSRRYFRNNAVVHVDTGIYNECRWETIEPQASGVAHDAWAAMASADAADGFVWQCPHCRVQDPDGELHMYCGQDPDRTTPQGFIADAVRDLEFDAERMRETLRGILVFNPPPNMTREDIIAAYREHARRCLDGEDIDDVED